MVGRLDGNERTFKSERSDIMKSRVLKVLTVATVSLVVLTGCDTQTSGDINVQTDEIQYRKDQRTDLCFAFLASRKSNPIGVGNMTGMGMTHVPCSEEVLRLIR